MEKKYKYENIKLVILAAGHASRLYPLTIGFPKCLLSVNQIPGIFNMINPMIKEGLKDIIFVVNSENKSIIESFMKHSFELLNLNITFVIQSNFEGPAAALKLVKKYVNKPILLLLGDTLCEIPTNFDYNFIGVSEIDYNKDRFCMINYNENNNEIIDFIDKSKNEMNTNMAAIAHQKAYLIDLMKPIQYENFQFINEICGYSIIQNDKNFDELNEFIDTFLNSKKKHLVDK